MLTTLLVKCSSISARFPAYKKRSLSSREQFQLEEDRRFFGLGKLLRLSRDLFSNLLYRVNYGFGGRHTLPLKERLILRIQAPRIEKLTTTPISFPDSPSYVCIKTIGYGTLHIEPYMENNKELEAFEVSINEVSEHTFALPLHVSFRIYVRNYMGKGCLEKSQLYDFPKREYSIIPFQKNRNRLQLQLLSSLMQTYLQHLLHLGHVLQQIQH